jgi:hypothetical protein
MPSKEKALSSRAISKVSDFHPDFVNVFWSCVERCLREAFGKSESEARQAVVEMRERMNGLSEEAVLLVYHDSPIQIAANLAGAANRPLTEKELLAYDDILNAGRKDRPSRDEILRGHIQNPRFGTGVVIARGRK